GTSEAQDRISSGPLYQAELERSSEPARPWPGERRHSNPMLRCHADFSANRLTWLLLRSAGRPPVMLVTTFPAVSAATRGSAGGRTPQTHGTGIACPDCPARTSPGPCPC